MLGITEVRWGPGGSDPPHPADEFNADILSDSLSLYQFQGSSKCDLHLGLGDKYPEFLGLEVGMATRAQVWDVPWP